MLKIVQHNKFVNIFPRQTILFLKIYWEEMF